MSQAFGQYASIVVGTWPVLPGSGELPGVKVDKLSCNFQVNRDLSEAPNSCELEILNLNPDNRERIKDSVKGEGALVSIEAGFEGDFGQIFLGICNSVETYKDQNDWVLRLSIDDGAEEEEDHPTKPNKKTVSKLDLRFGRGMPVSVALQQMVEAAGLQMSAVTAALPIALNSGALVFPYPVAFKGPKKKQLARLANSTNLDWSIQNGFFEGALRGLPFNPTGPLLRTGGTLLQARTDADGNLQATCLLDYRLSPGTAVAVDGASVKGAFTLDSVSHSGSTMPGGNWATSLTGIPL